jgi:glycosyltransferase involved in cell wall biosynthesis
MPDRLRVAVDATPLLGAVTGVGRVLQEVLPRLHQRPDLEVSAFAMTWRGRNRLPAVVPPGMRVSRRPLPARPSRALWKHFDHPRIGWWTGPADVVHGTYVVPPSRPAAEVVTVHDLTFVRFPEMCTTDTLQYPELIRRAVRRGAWVHAPSHATADEVVAAFAVPEHRVVVVPLGVTAPPSDAPGDPAEGRRLAGAERYLLALGTVEPRKGLPTLVDAFAQVVAEHPDVRLVIGGPDGWGADALADALARVPRAAERTTRLGWLPEPDRAHLLRGASALVYPSIYEGFGLPPLEAMAVGVPVVSTTAGSLPEILGDAALLVEPGDDDALAESLCQVLEDDDVRARLIASGRVQAARWTWDETAEGLAALYHRARS